MPGMSRRRALELLASAPLAASLTWTLEEALAAHRQLEAARATGVPFAPRFFTREEYETVKVLADLVIPADERSPGAIEAGVPEFIDFMVQDQPELQTAMRGGLAWLDREAEKRFDKAFVDCLETERAALLDDIAWPERARPELSHGVAFFNQFRDLTASGFWTSKIGIDDLQYMGNEFVAEWKGCPPAVLEKLGLGKSPGEPR